MVGQMIDFEKCPICETPQIRTRGFDVPVFRHADFSTVARRVDVQLCETCGVVVSPTFFPNEKKLFKEASYRKAGLAGRSKVSSKGGVIKTRASMQVKRIKGVVRRPGPVVLDIGCYDGALLCELATHYEGADLNGVDVMVGPRNETKVHKNVTFSCDLDEALKRKYDLIVISHTISYLSNLPEILPRLANALSDDGYLYIQMPDVTKNPYYLLMGDQYYTFSPSSLRYVLGLYGFDSFIASAPEFAREVILVAQHHRSQAHQQTVTVPGPSEVEAQFETLLQKVSRAKAYDQTTHYGIFGTTVNAAFVDELIGNQETFFVDDDPYWKERSFRGRNVKRPEQLKRTDKVFFPYGAVMQERVARRTKANLVAF